MQVKEILNLACNYLGKEELLSSNYFVQNGEELSADLQKDLNKLLNCLNVITEEIATSYIPLLKEKEVVFTDGKIGIDEIDDNVAMVVSVKSKSGKTLKFKYYCDKVVCLANTALITYKVYPSELTLNGDAQTFGNRLSARVLAYGVASEYAYSEMLFDDATIWETRFKNALLYASEKKGELNMKKRGWF